ncbi:MFS transporter, partial [Campylobacter coli]|uniref:MFS transporter n=1 Tax=Campylobacter coli TaxID=195 RepID=UPI003F7B3E80
YLLASTVMVPIYGKLSDIYGRKPILVIGICIFLAGSWLCGLSGAFGDLFGGGMVQLIVFRALQGLGGGALFTSAFAVIADLFPPKERGKFAG